MIWAFRSPRQFPATAHGSDLAFGFGAARTREEAASSALGEMVQFHITKRLQGAQGASPPAGFLAWCGSARLEENAFLRPAHYPRRHSVGKSQIVQTLSTCCPRAGLDPLLVDFTMPVPAFMWCAPSCRARVIWPRFAPGRLYDIPFRLGWHTRQMTETELNPVPILY